MTNDVSSLRPAHEQAGRIFDALQEGGGQERVSSYVRTILGYRGQSVSELSRAIGMSQFQVGRRLAGQLAWTPVEVFTLADEFGVSADDVTAGVPAPPWRFME